jgi:hypothetical protein
MNLKDWQDRGRSLQYMGWMSEILARGITLLVARLLQPSDYGLIGMAANYLFCTAFTLA